MNLHEQRPIPPIVSLRFGGDIISLLPLIYWLSKMQGGPVKLVTHSSYTGILDGVSYVAPVIWDDDMENPLEACQKFGAVNAQVFGRGLNPDLKHSDRMKQAWAQLGYKWKRHLPLVFDRRNLDREAELANRVFETNLPKVLVATSDSSIPKPMEDAIKTRLANEFSSQAEIVNLADAPAEKPYDLLGLMDRAACMITATVKNLALARASRCPVISLLNPTPSLTVPPAGNVLLRMPHTAITSRWDEIVRTIYATLYDLGRPGIALAFSPHQSTDLETRKREESAQQTWPLLNARPAPFHGTQRNSKSVGDNRAIPFLKDMIERAINTGGERIIAITNNDILFDKELGREVVGSCEEFGCYWAYRRTDAVGNTDRGADFFAFTRKWWFTHRQLMPDLLVACPWWDNLLVRIMCSSGCHERPRLYSHVPHPGVMNRGKTPGWEHNERLSLAWLDEHHELKEMPE